MRFKSVVAAAAALVLGGSVSAGPVTWSFSAPSNGSYFPDGASGGITFPNTASQAGGSSITAARVAEWSIAGADSPDRVSGLAYTFDLELRDDLSGQTAMLTFQGLLSGTFWHTGADLTSTFTGATTQTATVGGNLLTVSLTGFESPSGYGDESAGRITAGVRVGSSATDVGGGSGVKGESLGPQSPSAAPEPATLLLAALGLPAAAVMRRVRRRAARPAPSADTKVD
jgi:hypothetical protein